MNSAIHNVLAPQLYSILEERFGEVRIANQGEAAVWGGTCYVNGHIRRTVVHPGENYRIGCPFCQDLRFRLYVAHFYGQPDRGNDNRPMTWCVKCFNENCLADPVNRRRFADRVIGFRNQNARLTWEVRPGVRAESGGEPQLPGTCLNLKDLQPSHPAIQYLISERRLPYGVLDKYHLGLCIEPNPRLKVACWLDGRIIIPIRFQGETVGWQARYVGNPPNKDIPKYVTMPGMKKSEVLYNFDRAVNQPYAVVVEGVTDVWAVGDCAVAAFGRTLSARQHALLGEHWRGKPVVLLLDGDARESREKESASLRRSGNHPAVVVVQLPEAYDPGAYDWATINRIVHAQAAEAGVSLYPS